jgi:competence ComEA-like helix-hairpin-helix protein
MLKKLSERIGFTQTEIKVSLLLLIVFIIGFGYKTFFQNNNISGYKKFDYSSQDSLFLSSGNNSDSVENNTTENEAENKNNVLELNKKSNFSYHVKVIAAEKSIDLNTAGIKELTTIPGIGSKNAEKIIQLRKEAGKFTSVDDLLRIKGIGKSKLAKISKYVFIK